MQQHLYFLGIGGTLMGSLALLAKDLGHSVSGSDGKIYPPMSDLLANADITVYEGFEPGQLEPAPDLVIVGNANLPRGSEAIEYVLNQGLRYTSGAQWLGENVLQDRWVIAVAGTHGKTTTASMVAWILDYAGLSPGYLIGGAPANFETSARLGEMPFSLSKQTSTIRATLTVAPNLFTTGHAPLYSTTWNTTTRISSPIWPPSKRSSIC